MIQHEGTLWKAERRWEQVRWPRLFNCDVNMRDGSATIIIFSALPIVSVHRVFCRRSWLEIYDRIALEERSNSLSYFHLLMPVLTFANPFTILCGALSLSSNFVFIDG